MPTSAFINTPCTLIRRSGSTTLDDYGNEVPTSSSSVATVCELQQRRRDEVGDAQTSETLWDVFFPPGTTFDTGDSVDVAGQGTFQFVGAPWAVSAPWSQEPSHVEATARQIAGADEQS